jgi:predicted nucleic acid-binding Zn ribbon protein|tara:strand:+ start:502 stop:654 length:153 start_codon:yes stop_codon:yes gene_type:complete
MTVEDRLAYLEEIMEVIMDDPALRHKIIVAKLKKEVKPSTIVYEIKANYQ